MSNLCRFITNCFSCFQSTADDNDNYMSRGATDTANKPRSQAVSKMHDGPGERGAAINKSKIKKGTQQMQLLSSMPTPENP